MHQSIQPVTQCYYDALVESSKVILPSLRVKLGLMKIFFKAMDGTGEAVLYLRRKFPHLTEAKI